MTGQQGGLFLSENEYYVDENKKVVLCNSEKKDNLFRKRYKLTHGDKCYSIIKYCCPEVKFISIKINKLENNKSSGSIFRNGK